MNLKPNQSKIHIDGLVEAVLLVKNEYTAQQSEDSQASWKQTWCCSYSLLSMMNNKQFLEVIELSCDQLPSRRRSKR